MNPNLCSILFFAVIAGLTGFPGASIALDSDKSKEYKLKQGCKIKYNKGKKVCRENHKNIQDPEDDFLNSCLRDETLKYKTCIDEVKTHSHSPSKEEEGKTKEELLKRWTF